MYQNMGKKAYKKDLTNTLELLDVLGNPHKGMRWVHVAGTNGKGSVSSMLASILTTNGYKTGLYTSPHLLDYTERIRIDGISISHNEVISFVERIKPHCVRIQPSFFEITVAMAFDHFHRQQIEVGVIEVGLGGRLDSTNVIHPLLSVITSIGWDHMDMLGDTLEKIAFEKAGIIKANIPVVYSRHIPQEAQTIISQRANEIVAPSHLRTINPEKWNQKLSLKGSWQRINLETAYTAYLELSKVFNFDLSKTLNALENIPSISGIRGRWEIISYENTSLILETGHNEEAILLILETLKREQPNKTVQFIWGMVADKDRDRIIQHLPKDAEYHLVKPGVVRGLETEILAQSFKALNLRYTRYESIGIAIKTIVHRAQEDTIVFIGGSTFVVADALNYLEP